MRISLKGSLVLITVALLVGSMVQPLYLRDQAFQHVPTGLAIVVLAIDARKNWCSRPTFLCLTLFLWLHILGARYIYSYVPYDEWAAILTGTTVSEWFGWSRNHYDRLVHFLFGVLFIIPGAEAGQRCGIPGARRAIGFAMLLVLSCSALYEVFEWLLTIVMSPQNAEAYNGQQGDVWDAQKDMTLAFAGSAIMASILIALRTRTRAR